MFFLTVKICSLFKMSAWGEKRVLALPPSISTVIVSGSSQTPPNSSRSVPTIYVGINCIVIKCFTNYKYDVNSTIFTSYKGWGRFYCLVRWLQVFALREEQ